MDKIMENAMVKIIGKYEIGRDEKEYKFTRYAVSNFGKIFKLKSGKQVTITEGMCYLKDDGGNMHKVSAKKLIIDTFIPEYSYHVQDVKYIDGNSDNLAVSNMVLQQTQKIKKIDKKSDKYITKRKGKNGETTYRIRILKAGKLICDSTRKDRDDAIKFRNKMWKKMKEKTASIPDETKIEKSDLERKKRLEIESEKIKSRLEEKSKKIIEEKHNDDEYVYQHIEPSKIKIF